MEQAKDDLAKYNQALNAGDFEGAGSIVGEYASSIVLPAKKLNTLNHLPSRKKSRLPRTNGEWISGKAGDGLWKSSVDDVNEITKGKPIPFVSGKPVFTEWVKGEITFKLGALDGTNKDFAKVYKKIKAAKGFRTQAEAKVFLSEKGLTPHHLSSTVIQLVPSKLHGNIPHIGSASEMRTK